MSRFAHTIEIVRNGAHGFAAIAKAVPVDFKTHEEGETRHWVEAKKCWETSYIAEGLGQHNIVESEARHAVEQHTHRIGHKIAKEGGDEYPLSRFC